MASLITEFAGKSPDFEKGWLEKVSLYKLIPIFVGKSRYIFILVILYVKKTYTMLKKHSQPNCP